MCPLRDGVGGRSVEGGDAGDVASDEQRLDRVGSLVGRDHLHVYLHVGQVTRDVVAQEKTVSAEDVAGLATDGRINRLGVIMTRLLSRRTSAKMMERVLGPDRRSKPSQSPLRPDTASKARQSRYGADHAW